MHIILFLRDRLLTFRYKDMLKWSLSFFGAVVIYECPEVSPYFEVVLCVSVLE